MKNGRADHHDDDPDRDPKIARIEDARRRRQFGLGDGNNERGSKRPAAPRSSIKELLVGAVIVAMAVGFLVHLTRPLWQGLMASAP
jgi:hypothetical protein